MDVVCTYKFSTEERDHTRTRARSCVGSILIQPELQFWCLIPETSALLKTQIFKKALVSGRYQATVFCPPKYRLRSAVHYECAGACAFAWVLSTFAFNTCRLILAAAKIAHSVCKAQSTVPWKKLTAVVHEWSNTYVLDIPAVPV